MGIKLIVLIIIVAVSIAYFCPCAHKDPEIPVLKDEWWGKLPADGKIPADDMTIRSFTVPYKESDVKDLQERLLRARLSEPLQNIQFQYGFNTDYLKQVLNYWRTKYDWKKQVNELNKYQQFVTQIEGISVHYIHVKPKITNKKIRVLPLMLIHGWPGSVVEFYKIIPLLTTPKEGKDYVFEVICPSIPGYGFSEAPHQPGFHTGDAARVFNKLMDRLKHKNYYVQGGDWGSFIAKLMSAIYPDRVTGVHVTMIGGNSLSCKSIFKLLISLINPNWVMEPDDQKLMLPVMDKIKLLIQETGYLHLQATKPDTVGVGLGDSPAGLAAYILEKFSTWTDPNNVNVADGGLTKKLNLDELLNNVMLYWVTNSITSSVRFYKENFSERFRNMEFDKLPVHVPSAVALFSGDLYTLPKLLDSQLRNITQYTHMPRGGHFAAMEEPSLLAEDIWKFAGVLEKS